LPGFFPLTLQWGIVSRRPRWSIPMALSLRITSKLASVTPAFNLQKPCTWSDRCVTNDSNVCLLNSPFKLEAIAIPSAAEIEVEWPTPKYRSRFRFWETSRVDDWYENFLFGRSRFYVHRFDGPHPKSINSGVKNIMQGNCQFNNT
jgi:hypothetical protein